MKKWLLIIIWLWAGWLRVNKLTVSPPGLYADETSIGYNAYSILKTGKDEYGVSWPLFFRAFGEYKNPVFIYSLAPIIAVNGLEPLSIRLGAALWGTLGIIMIGLVAYEISNSMIFSSLVSAALALMPWHLHYSRLGFEAITMPTLMTAALWCLLKWLKSSKSIWVVCWGLMMMMSFFSYTTARLWMPVFLGLLLLMTMSKVKKRKQLWWAAGIMALAAGWLISWLKIYPESLMARMNQIAIWGDKPSPEILISRFINTYFKHFSFDFLFSKGDSTVRHASGVNSELLKSWGLFLITGITVALKKQKREFVWRLALIMAALFPLAASLTMTSPIATRTIQATPFLALLIGLGAWWSINKLKRNKVLLLVFVFFWTVVIGTEFNQYYQDLIYQYPQRVWMPWHGFDGSLGKAIIWTDNKSREKRETFFMSDKIEQAYIQGLFFTKADPEKWQIEKKTNFKVDNSKVMEKEEIWLVTAKECRNISQLVVLKTFGRETDNYDYCAVEKI